MHQRTWETSRAASKRCMRNKRNNARNEHAPNFLDPLIPVACPNSSDSNPLLGGVHVQ